MAISLKSPHTPPARRRLEQGWPWSAGQLQEQHQQSRLVGLELKAASLQYPCHCDKVSLMCTQLLIADAHLLVRYTRSFRCMT